MLDVARAFETLVGQISTELSVNDSRAVFAVLRESLLAVPDIALELQHIVGNNIELVLLKFELLLCLVIARLGQFQSEACDTLPPAAFL